mmetsp:Transcript_56669/g.137738  ORF Transcript_56669/g.137738 Transcript_56669/m.137738 type:complete len:289 (-) Transcript_56669:31-897(-)
MLDHRMRTTGGGEGRPSTRLVVVPATNLRFGDHHRTDHRLEEICFRSRFQQGQMIHLVVAAQTVPGVQGHRSQKSAHLVRHNYHDSDQKMATEQKQTEKKMVAPDSRPMPIVGRHGKRMPGIDTAPVVCCCSYCSLLDCCTSRLRTRRRCFCHCHRHRRRSTFDRCPCCCCCCCNCSCYRHGHLRRHRHGGRSYRNHSGHRRRQHGCRHNNDQHRHQHHPAAAAAAAVFLRPTPVKTSFVLLSFLPPSPDCDEAMLLLALLRLVMECCRDLIVVQSPRNNYVSCRKCN